MQTDSAIQVFNFTCNPSIKGHKTITGDRVCVTLIVRVKLRHKQCEFHSAVYHFVILTFQFSVCLKRLKTVCALRGLYTVGRV